MSNNEKQALQRSRREFLKTAGKLAVYTPPAMIAMSQPSFSKIARSGGMGGSGGGPGGGGGMGVGGGVGGGMGMGVGGGVGGGMGMGMGGRRP